MLRVLLLSDFFPPHVGGVELQVQALARALAQRGHVVNVATVSQVGLPRRVDDDGVTVHRLPALTTQVPWFSGDPSRRYHPPFPDPALAWSLTRLVSRIRPDVIQAHGWIAYSAALAGIAHPVPLVLSVRDYGYTCATRSMLLDGRICSGPGLTKCLRHASNWYGRAKGVAATLGVLSARELLRSRVTAIHAVSHYVGTAVQRDLLGDLEREIATIPDIILRGSDSRADDPVVAEVVAQLPTQPYILFVGALQAHKGLGPLLTAYRRLQHAPPLVLIGTTWPDTPDRFPDGVTVIRNAPHPAVMAAWRRSLFGVAPSIWPDPLPGVVREAMIVGRPVVGSRVGGIVDMIVDGESGLLVPPGDATALAEAMQLLLDDPELRARLGAGARASATEIQPDRVVSAFEALYDALARDVRRPDAPLRGLPDAVRRIHVVGGSGTGKSTFAESLARRLGVTAHHLDDIARISETGERRPESERLALVRDIAARPSWITEGIHVGWTDELFGAADAIVWLDDIDWQEALARVIRRFLGGWVAETRRRGLRHVLRPRSYARHLLELLGAMREIPRYGAADNRSTDDASSRRATAEQLRPYLGKVVHCRRRGDRDRIAAKIVRLAPGEDRPDPDSGTVAAEGP